MSFLYLLEGIRNPVLDTFFGIVTYLGDEIVFLALAMTVVWCINKNNGYYLLCSGLVGTLVNQALKITFRIPRPWVIDPNFTAVESAIPAATGYSFPSGHTQNAASTFGGVARFAKKKLIKGLAIAAVLVTAFSRMYLGVHTPLDVGVSLVIGCILVILLYPAFKYAESHKNAYYVIFGALAVLSLIFLIVIQIVAPHVDFDPHHIASATNNAATLVGASIGMLIAHFIDSKFTNFDVKAPLVGQILKLVIGFVIVIALKSGIKVLFGGSDEHFILRCVRYMILVIFAAGVYPMTFKWFAKLGKKK